MIELNLEAPTHGRKYVSTDAFKRLSLSAELRKEIGLPVGRKAQVWIAVDRGNKYITFARPDDVTFVTDALLCNVSKRGYIYAPGVYAKLGLPYERRVFRHKGAAEKPAGVTWQVCELVSD